MTPGPTFSMNRLDELAAVSGESIRTVTYFLEAVAEFPDDRFAASRAFFAALKQNGLDDSKLGLWMRLSRDNSVLSRRDAARDGNLWIVAGCVTFDTNGGSSADMTVGRLDVYERDAISAEGDALIRSLSFRNPRHNLSLHNHIIGTVADARAEAARMVNAQTISILVAE